MPKWQFLFKKNPLKNPEIVKQYFLINPIKKKSKNTNKKNWNAQFHQMKE